MSVHGAWADSEWDLPLPLYGMASRDAVSPHVAAWGPAACTESQQGAVTRGAVCPKPAGPRRPRLTWTVET